MINNMEFVQNELPALLFKLLNTEEFSRAAENAQCPNAQNDLVDKAMTRVTNKTNEIFQTKACSYGKIYNKKCIINKKTNLGYILWFDQWCDQEI
jgi:hypothetical protein